MDKDVNQFVGQRLYKALHTGKLSKRAQEVTGMPLINYNINYNNCVQKEPLKRTFSAFAGTTNTDGVTQPPRPQNGPSWPHWAPTTNNYGPLDPTPLDPMPEVPTSKAPLCETLSMPLLPNYYPLPMTQDDPHGVEIGSGDEERLLPTDLLNDDDFELEKSNKVQLRKTWSWTHEDPQDPRKVDSPKITKNVDSSKTKNMDSPMRHLERAIKSLSIDPNVSLSRKF